MNKLINKAKAFWQAKTTPQKAGLVVAAVMAFILLNAALTQAGKYIG